MPAMAAVAKTGTDSGVELNAFFTSRGEALVFLDHCPGCGTETAGKPFATVRGHHASEGAGVALPAVRCPACALVFLNPRLSEAAVSAFYNESPRLLSYFTSGFKDAVDRGRGFVPFMDFIEKQLGGSKGELLDLGCGAGAFIRLMQARGFKAVGAELAAPVASHAREQGLDVITADAEGAIATYRAQGRSFDVITMIHAFEHLPYPLKVLKALQAILKPRGLVAINVPNVRFPLARLDQIFGSDMGGIWDPVGHFNYFSLRSLSNVLGNAGYDVAARYSRLLAYGRTGFLGLVDNVVSVPCSWFGGFGGNIAVAARLR